MLIEAGLQRPSGGGHEYPALTLEPGHRLPGVADALGHRACLQRGQAEGAAERTQLQRRRMRGVQVVIKHPGGRRAPLGLVVG
jgi:hypothetical protein